MPYIIETRTDIPNGLLQTLDLMPNTSIREDGYQPVGQTGYRRVVVDGAVEITTGVFTAEGTGLVAWIAANCSAGSGVTADCVLTLDTFANLADGETFTIDDGENSAVFEIKKTATYIVAATSIEVDITGATTAADVSAICETVILASDLNVFAVDAVGTVTLDNSNRNQPTADQNNAGNAETLGGLGALTAWANATNSASQTAAAAATNAADIIARAASGASLDYTGINGILSTGEINKEDVVEILALLAGAVYTVPNATSIGTTAFVNAALDNAIAVPVEGRHVYDSGRLRISFAEGRLSKAVAATFSYSGVTGAALAVYNDDGSVYTG